MWFQDTEILFLIISIVKLVFLREVLHLHKSITSIDSIKILMCASYPCKFFFFDEWILNNDILQIQWKELCSIIPRLKKKYIYIYIYKIKDVLLVKNFKFLNYVLGRTTRFRLLSNLTWGKFFCRDLKWWRLLINISIKSQKITHLMEWTRIQFHPSLLDDFNFI